MESKRVVRAGVLRARAARSAAAQDVAGRGIDKHGVALATDTSVVVAYAAVGNEPPTRPLLQSLVERGVRVVLPVVTAGGSLAWGEFVDWPRLVESPSGLLEPEAAPEAAAAARSADLLLVPALAVDRAGHRLGRGGGYFDRWLPAQPAGRVVAVVFDDEVLDEVPHEPHDRPVDAALTPGGVIPLGVNREGQ